MMSFGVRAIATLAHDRHEGNQISHVVAWVQMHSLLNL